MSAPLLQTKLHIPPLRSEFVSRPHLLERLDEGLRPGCKLILISAPAGFGKTTLLSEWAGGVGQPVAWLSLDKEDNDLNRFFAYLLAALQRIDPQIGQTAQAMLQAPQPPAPEALPTTVINDMADTAQPFILVFDDYHLIEARPIHDTLAYLLQHSPPHVHLVLATRVDPPLPIPRLRGRGQLVGLYQADLRFTVVEAAEFLNQVMGLNLMAEDVAALERRTEGWIAGLQMAAVSMRGRDDVAGFVQAFTGSHRYILDYLGGEVLRQQPRSVGEFLLQTAILDRLTAPLCDAVIAGAALGEERDGSQGMLEYLESSNLFIVPLDDERRWYRYHRLFADLLRQRLHRERPGLSVELHRRASRWYEENGLVEEAVSHALAASDYEQAASLLEPSGWEMVTRGACTTLLGWLDAFPDTFLRSRPQLHIFRAWCLVVTGQGGIAESSLADIENEHVQGEIAAVRAYAASVRGDPRQGIEFAQQALEQLPRDNLALRGFLALNLGIAYSSSGEPAAASRVLNQAIELSRATAFTDLTLAAMGVLGHVQQNQARLHQGVETHRDVLDLARQLGDLQAPVIGMAHLGIAEVLYEWNELDEAVDYVAEGIRLLERGRFITYMLFGYSLRAQARHAHGDLNGAQIALQQAERLAKGSDFPYMTAVLGGLRARLSLARGNAEAAARWAGEHRWFPDGEFDHAREVEQIAVARMLIAQDRPSEALSLLERLLEAARAAGRMWNAIRILALQALAFADNDDLDSALAALDQTLVLAEPEGFVRTFVDEGEPMARLLRHALSQGIAPEYVARLLAAFAEEAELKPPAMESMVEPLTERELQVLRLIVAGLSNPEIAEELFIAVSTVKSHVNHIYGKLGVSNRVEAVTRAQALGLA